MKSLRWLWLILVGSCGAPVGEPVLELKLSPKVVSDGTVVQVGLTAVEGDGRVGKGTVRVTSVAGSLRTPVEVELDSFGTGRVPFTCDPTMESACASSVRVVGEWTTGGKVIVAEARLNASGSSGTGGGSGAGGGAGSGGGSGQPNDAGVIILNNQCSATANPGTEPRCCYQPTVPKAPTCGWSLVTASTVFAIPFTLVDGGSPNTLSFVRYSVPAPINSATECAPDFGFDLQAGGLTGTFSMACYRFAVFEDQSWQLVTNSPDDCRERSSTTSPNYFQADCRDMFANSHIGSVRQMTKAVIVNSAGKWLQSDDAVFVFPMRKAN